MHLRDAKGNGNCGAISGDIFRSGTFGYVEPARQDIHFIEEKGRNHVSIDNGTQL